MARTPVITPAAELAAVLAEWHRHRAAIVAAAESGDMAALRRLEEQEVDWLTDIAVAAGSLLGDRVLLEIRVENTYATGENFTRAFIVAVPPPAGGQDPDQWAAEHRATREGVILMDMSFMAKFLVQGSDAGRLLNYISANNVDGEEGVITYTQWLNEGGTLEADLTVTKLAEDSYWVVASDTAHRHTEAWIRRNTPDGAHCFVTDVTSGYGQINVQGPRSRELLQAVIEENLRMHAPVQMEPRHTTGPATLGGVEIPPGSAVLTFFGAANYDPQVFPEPLRFDLARANGTRHLGFGWGVHSCLGASLARLELRVGLQALRAALPELRLADPGAPRSYLPSLFFRTPAAVPALRG